MTTCTTTTPSTIQGADNMPSTNTPKAVTTTDLEQRQREAAAEAERLAKVYAEHMAAREAAEVEARLEAARAYLATGLPAQTAALEDAEARLNAVAANPTGSLDLIWATYLEVRSLARRRHREHTVANGELDRHDPMGPNKIGVDQARRAVADTWAETPWWLLVDRIIENRLTKVDAEAYASRHATLEKSTAEAVRRFDQ